MRLSIRYQLLLPLLVRLMLGVVGMSTWTAWSSAQRARRQIEAQMQAIAETEAKVSIPLNAQTLKLMKGLSSADFLVCDDARQPLVDDLGRAMTTLPALPGALPAPAEATAGDLGAPVVVAGTPYFVRGVALQHGAPPARFLYVFYPEALWRDALWQSLRPALFLGVLGALAAAGLALAVTQRVTRRIEQMERRTRLIAAGDFSPMPLPRRDDELRDLGRSVNDMAQQLGAAYQVAASRTERLRLLGQVSGGLAHQLRNGVAERPVSRCSLHGRECAADRETFGCRPAPSSTLVEMHLKRFLDLGKALDLAPREKSRVADVGRRSYRPARPQCRHAHIDMQRNGCVGTNELPLLADPGQMGHVLLNVLTNAIEAAGPGGRIEVRFGTRRGGSGVRRGARPPGRGSPQRKSRPSFLSRS